MATPSPPATIQTTGPEHPHQKARENNQNNQRHYQHQHQQANDRSENISRNAHKSTTIR
jgi:hypothetical protein